MDAEQAMSLPSSPPSGGVSRISTFTPPKDRLPHIIVVIITTVVIVIVIIPLVNFCCPNQTNQKSLLDVCNPLRRNQNLQKNHPCIIIFFVSPCASLNSESRSLAMTVTCWLVLYVSFAVVIVSATEVRRRLEATLTSDHERRILSEIYEQYDAEFVDRFFVSRRRLELAVVMEQLNTTGYHHTWQILPEVDGLKNTEIVSFVTSTGNHNEYLLWERYACSLLDTS